MCLKGNLLLMALTFSAPLNLSATGKIMKVLDALLGMDSVPMTGSVTTSDNKLTVTLAASNDTEITAAIASHIPLIGSQTQKAWISIDNETAKSATKDDSPAKDEMDLHITIAVGSSTGTLKTQVPMSVGKFNLGASFTNFGVTLSDLNFLANGTDFAKLFPTDLPSSYYTSSTKLELLDMGLSLQITTSPKFSVKVSGTNVSIGIVDIPLYNKALWLNPLSVAIKVSNPSTGSPSATWGLKGEIALYPYATQSTAPAGDPDFTFDFKMQMPNQKDPTFAVSGEFGNEENLSVATIICDLMDDGTFDTGISNKATLDKFDFDTKANTNTGTISEFSVDIAMSSQFGIFDTSDLDVKDFSISVSYES